MPPRRKRLQTLKRAAFPPPALSHRLADIPLRVHWSMGISIDNPALISTSTEHLQETRDHDGKSHHWGFRLGECLDPRGPVRRNPRRGAETGAGEQPCVRPRLEPLSVILTPVQEL